MVVRGACALALVVGLSACNQAGTDRESDLHAHAPDGSQAQSGMSMHEAMASAVGADVSDTWVRKMIAHHEGALEMTDAVIADGGDPRVVAIARRMAAAQRQEIAEMRGLIRSAAAPDPVSARPYLASEKRMHDAMMAAGGSDPSQAFVRQMIPHHQGAVAMSEIVLAHGRDERVAAIARRIIADQGREIAEMEAMLAARAAPSPAGSQG